MTESDIDSSLEIEESERASPLDSDVYKFIYVGNKNSLIKELSTQSGYSPQVLQKYFGKVKKNFLKSNISEETYDCLYDLITHPKNRRKSKFLEELMKREFPALKKMRNIRKHESSEDSWRGIDRLGLNYFKEVQKGYGTTPENRSRKQIEIANQVVERTLPFIEMLVSKFLDSREIYYVSRKDLEIDEKEEVKVEVKWAHIKADENFLGDKEELKKDLVNHSLKRVIEKMDYFIPEISRMSSSIGMVVRSEIMRYLPSISPVKISHDMYEDGWKIIDKTDSKEEVVKRVENSVNNREEDCPLFPYLVHDSLRGEVLSLEEVLDENVGENESFRPFRALTGKGLNLGVYEGEEEDSFNQPKGEEYLEERDEKSIPSIPLMEEETKKLITGLVNRCVSGGKKTKERNKKMLLYYFLGLEETLRSSGGRINLTPESVRQIKDKFNRRIRHPANENLREDLREILYGKIGNTKPF